MKVWKPITEYENLYQISNHGEVRSLDRASFHKEHKNLHSIKGKLLKNVVSDTGYYRVVLSKDSKKKIKKVHILLMQAFKEYDSNLVVDHIDGKKLNNNLNNLRMVSRSQNQWNRKANSNSSSKYKGVSWDSTHKKWKVQILFNDEIMAAKAYDIMAKQVGGKYARLNQVMIETAKE